MENGLKRGKKAAKTAKIKRKHNKTIERVIKGGLFNGKETAKKTKDSPRASRGD